MTIYIEIIKKLFFLTKFIILSLSKIIFWDRLTAMPLILALMQFLIVSKPMVGKSILRSWFTFGNFIKIDLFFNLYFCDRCNDLLIVSSVPSGPSIART